MDIPYEYAYKNNIVILDQDDKQVRILSKDCNNDGIVEELQKNTEKKILIFQSKKYNFNKYFEEYYNISYIEESIKDEMQKIKDLDIETLFSYIIKKAHEFLATDIHIINEEQIFIIKFRVNSILRTFTKLSFKKGESLVRIIKLKCNIDISKTVNPLEGRFDIEHIDYRVSIIPTISGEKISIRILGNTKNIYNFDDLGWNNEEQDIIKQKINKNSGCILVTGATGSGKSTTLFTILHYLNDGTKNIISIEDPVEYKIEGVTQISASKDKNIDFHNILKFILRQDPQIINIGEIRDEETAKLAMDSANTGHMVFSTMHTNSSISSIQRLNDLNLENFEIANSLSLIISQRLVRVLCQKCKRETKISDSVADMYGIDKNKTYYTSAGCSECLGTGYSNQVAVFEILDVNDDVKQMILENNIDEDKINIVTLKEKLLKMVELGQTTIQEITKYI